MKTVAILGASPKAGRFAYKALVKLKHDGYKVFPVHPKAEEIEGIKVFPSLSEIKTGIDTLTLYVGPIRMEKLVESVCDLKPRRVIFNPGTESEEIKNRFESLGIECVVDCTLIMLDQNTF